MPQLVRLYLKSVAIGFGLAVALVGFMMWQDVAGLRRLILASDVAITATFLLVFFNGMVFSATQFGIAVMSLESDDGPGGGLRDRSGLVPIPVEAKSPQRR